MQTNYIKGFFEILKLIIKKLRNKNATVALNSKK